MYDAESQCDAEGSNNSGQYWFAQIIIYCSGGEARGYKFGRITRGNNLKLRITELTNNNNQSVVKTNFN